MSRLLPEFPWPALFLLALGAAALRAEPGPSEALAALCRDHWQAELKNSPTWATYLGDHRYDDRLADAGEAARAARLEENLAFQKRLDAIAPSGLTPPERVTRDILGDTLALHRERHAHRFFEWNVDQMFGPQVWFLELLNSHPLKTQKNFADLGARFEAFPAHLEGYVADLKAGAASGRTAPRVAVERVIEQLRVIVATPPENSPLAAAIGKIPADLPAGTRSALADRLRRGIAEAVIPAYRRWLEYMDSAYRGKAREAVGLSALPGGAEAYRFKIREQTSTDLTAEEIHKIGMEELAGIHGEVEAIAKKAGFTGDARAFMDRMRGDAANFAKSREELLDGFRAILARADAQLPRWFGRLPKTRCEVKPIEDYREKDAVAAFYYSPPLDGSRPAYFYANTYDPPSRPKYNMTALTVHEAVPGHHLQIALAMELTDLPEFRRHGHYTAYVEGWALYSERLADEMGLYEDDHARFGMLTYQAWRAARLVVDTGIHAFGWDRAKAIEFMKRNVALTDGEIVNEIDRYIIWPGQALAYKIGQREILRLRSEAERELGQGFDIRRFHDAVLRNGAIPLGTLRKVVREWTDAEKAAK